MKIIHWRRENMKKEKDFQKWNNINLERALKFNSLPLCMSVHNS